MGNAIRWTPDDLAAHQARLRTVTVGPASSRPIITAPAPPAAAAALMVLPPCDVTVLDLPYPVSANRYWRSLGRGRVVVSEQGQDFKRAVRKRAVAAGLVEPLDGPVSIQIFMHPKQVKDHVARERKHGPLWHLAVRCIDLGNSEKILSDALNGLAWKDDRQIVEIIKRRAYPIDGGGVSVWIKRGMGI